MSSGKGLAGSTLTMMLAVKIVVENSGVSLVDTATLNPSRQLGHDGEIGSLEIYPLRPRGVFPNIPVCVTLCCF